MQRWILTALGVCLLSAILASSCGGRQKAPEVAPGHHLCTYCCTTANTECSCELLDAVDCPDPSDTARLAACAECRTCTRRIESGGSCDHL